MIQIGETGKTLRNGTGVGLVRYYESRWNGKGSVDDRKLSEGDVGGGGGGESVT